MTNIIDPNDPHATFLPYVVGSLIIYDIRIGTRVF